MLRRDHSSAPSSHVAPQSEETHFRHAMLHDKHDDNRQQNSSRSRDYASLAALLVTGTALAVYGQAISDRKVVHPSTQMLAWVKYLGTCIICGLNELRPSIKRTNHNSQVQSMTVVIGMLDVLAYSLTCIAVAYSGSALSTVVMAAAGQVCTAAFTRYILRRTLVTSQLAAVGVVCMGLLLRSLSPTRVDQQGHSRAALAALTPVQALGLACALMASISYSLLGVLYERTAQMAGKELSNSKMALQTSVIGLLAMSCYQLVYTWPRWAQLVDEPRIASGVPLGHVGAMFAGFGALFALHFTLQGRVLRREGAIAVGMVTALRAALVSVASGLMFCSMDTPHQCLTLWSAASAALVAAGAMLWVASKPTILAATALHQRVSMAGLKRA